MSPSLRDRKRERTRAALVEAATDLFQRQGYDETTVAEIAAAAEIGTRTFFSYFATKEDLLYPVSDARVRAVVDAIAARGADDQPVDILLRALRTVSDVDTDLVSPLAALRLRLIQTVPAVRGRGLQLQFDAQQEIARHLHDAFSEQLDEVSAGALVGAFVGATVGALQVLLSDGETIRSDPAQLHERLNKATRVALAPWLKAGPQAG